MYIFALNCLNKEMIYNFLIVQYIHHYKRICGTENIHGAKYILLYFKFVIIFISQNSIYFVPLNKKIYYSKINA